MVERHIEREVLVRASVETVWSVVSEPPHLRSWFSDVARVDLRPGGRATFEWEGHGSYPAVIVEVDPPRRLAFRWIRDEGVASVEKCSTLVVFELRAAAGGTLLTVRESGFDALPWSPEKRERYADENDAGWQRELGELVRYVATIRPDAS